MKKQNGKGLLALLGIGAGVYAWWKYNNLSPERKKELHGKVNEVGQKVRDTVNDVETTVKHKFDDLKTGAQRGLADVQQDVDQMKN